MARILVVAEVTAVRRFSCRSDGDSSQPAVAAGSGFLVIELGSPTPRSHFESPGQKCGIKMVNFW